MPLYQWTGRTPAGDAQSGALQASSKEAAIAALRARNVLVATITERTVSAQSGGFGRMFIALLLIAGAILMAMMAKGTRIRCTRTATAYDCTTQTTMAGFRVLYAEDIRGVRAATEEKRTSERVVLTGETATLASEWMAHPLASSDWVAGTLNENFAKRQATSFETWQVETPPAAVALVLAIVGVLLFLSGVRR